MSIIVYTENLIGTKPHLLDPFNYIKFYLDSKFEYSYTSPSLIKLSYELDPVTNHVVELKFTNNPIKSWIDLWCEAESQLPIDPLIEKMNISGSQELELVSIIEHRRLLTELNLSYSPKLSYVNLSGCHELTHLDLSGCIGLQKLNLGFIKNLKVLSVRNCNLPELALESVLSSYYPVLNALEPQQRNKRLMSSYIDLRGNYINWRNRKIASKIRLLVTNNILVLWDNHPPEDIIPLSYYKSLPTQL